MAGKLTDTKVKTAKASDKMYKLADGCGLFLLVWPTGKKTWAIRIRKDGKDTNRSLGSYPEMSLKDARRALEAYSDEVAKTGAPTFRKVAEEWMSKNRNVWRESYLRSIVERFAYNVYGQIGDIPINEITPRMILDKVAAPMEARGVISNAHKVLAHVGMVFRYAVASQYIESDPTRDLRGALTRIPDKHFSAATREEDIRLVVRAVHSYGGSLSVRLALEFLMLTFVRPGNVRFAKWEQFDLAGKVWVIPAEEMKMKRPHEVPLSRQAMDVLERAGQLKFFGSPFVFPPLRKKDIPLSDAAFNVALRSMGIQQEMHTAHGFRSMASTVLNERGYPFDIIEKQLAHVSADQIRGIYNRAEYWEKRVALMQAWADIVDEFGNKA